MSTKPRTNDDLLNEAVEVEMPSKDELLMREDELLDGLFAAIDEKENHTITKMLRIERAGKKLFEFDVRPLDEKELMDCRKKATKYGDNPAGKKFPRVELDTDIAKLRSIKIYTATTEEYRKKLWDNPKALEKYNVISGYDVIELALLAGEKDAIVDEIDALSAFGTSVESYAKN